MALSRIISLISEKNYLSPTSPERHRSGDVLLTFTRRSDDVLIDVQVGSTGTPVSRLTIISGLAGCPKKKRPSWGFLLNFQKTVYDNSNLPTING